MAVVQISRIQVRRGKKNSESGLPQLASGEMGWAIDSQELFIGNGSVAEGAPYVGNTKILTEHDDLFDLAQSYLYKRADTVPGTYERSLQDRLDDRVSIRNFINPTNPLTAQIQNALDQLFPNTIVNDPISGQENPNAVVLYLEEGEYVIDDTLVLPPFTTIIGAGKGKTIIHQTSNSPIFLIENDNLPNLISGELINETNFQQTSSYLNQPRYVRIEGMTLRNSGNAQSIVLNCCRNSVFRDLKIVGSLDEDFVEPTYNIDGSINQINDHRKGIDMISLSEWIASSNNIFENIEINNEAYAVYSDHDVKYNYFNNFYVHDCEHGISLDVNSSGGPGAQYGSSNNVIQSSRFDLISRHAIWIDRGTDNISRNNIFETVGGVDYSVIKFSNQGNISDNDSFDRTRLLSYNQAYINELYSPEIEGAVFGIQGYTHYIDVLYTGNWITMFRLSGKNTSTYRVKYLYKSIGSGRNMVRQGTMEIIVNKELGTPEVSVYDDYNFSGENESMSENLEFRVEYDAVNEAVLVQYLNSTLNEDGSLQYRLEFVQ